MALKVQQYRSLRRKHRQMVLLNDHEIDAFNRYCKKYKINNKSKVIREALFSKVLKTFEDDYPTLFDQSEMTRMERPD
jgi:ABC-type phosphate/phosphonate transport system ATPase subunit